MKTMLTGPQLLKRLWAGAGLWFGLSWPEVSCTTVETWREPQIVEKHGGGGYSNTAGTQRRPDRGISSAEQNNGTLLGKRQLTPEQ